MEWWQRLKLNDNPFERLRSPLTGSMEYVVETPIYEKFSGRIDSIGTLFGKVFVIYGQFGSGKTTLFEYLTNKLRLLDKKIEPIFLRISKFTTDGDEIFQLALSQLYKMVTEKEKENIDSIDISNALIIRSHERKTDGYIIFIDELHHNPNIDAIFDFFKHLQGLTETIFPDNKVGIFIAGRDEWCNRLENPIYSGPIDNYDRINEITCDQAYQIVTKRINEFITDDNYRDHKYITRDAIDKIYDGLKEVTPRQLLIDTREAFENLVETSMTLTSLDVSRKADPATIEAVRKKIRSIPSIYNKLTKIRNEYKTDTEKTAAYRFISKLYEKKFIPKKITSEILREFGLKDSFILNDMKIWGIIQDHSSKIMEKGQYGSVSYTKTGYILDETLSNTIGNIINDYGLYPEDFLEKIFIPEDIKAVKLKKKDIIKTKEEEHLWTFLNKMKKNKYSRGEKHIQRCIDEYRKIVDFLDSPRTRVDPSDIPNKCKTSLYDLFSTYYIYQQKNDDVYLDPENLANYSIGIFYSEELSNFFHEYKILESEANKVSRSEAGSIAGHYIQTLKEILPEIMQDVEYGILELDPKSLTKQDLSIYREIRILLLKDSSIDINVEKARDMTIKYFEKKMRNSIAGILNIQFGERWYKDKVPGHAKEGISRALGSREQAEPDFQRADNLLVYSDQIHLRDIILHNWKQCFGFIFNRSEEDKKEFEVNWNTIYRKRNDFAHIDDSKGRYVMKAFDDAVLITQWLNKGPEKFLKNPKVHIEKKDSYYNIYFTDPKICNPEPITQEEAEKIWKPMSHLHETIVRFSDMPPFFTANGRKEFAVYLFLIKQGCLSIKSINANAVTFSVYKDALAKNES